MTESYRVLVSEAGNVLREWDVAGAAAIYSAVDQAADYPAGGAARVEVAQLGADGLPGAWTALDVTIPAP